MQVEMGWMVGHKSTAACSAVAGCAGYAAAVAWQDSLTLRCAEYIFADCSARRVYARTLAWDPLQKCALAAGITVTPSALHALRMRSLAGPLLRMRTVRTPSHPPFRYSSAAEKPNLAQKLPSR